MRPLAGPEEVPTARLRLVLGTDCAETVVTVQWFGCVALRLISKEPSGKDANVFLHRHDEPRLDLFSRRRSGCRQDDHGGALHRGAVTVTRNAVLYSLSKPEKFILAIVEFLDNESHRAHYVRRPLRKDPDCGTASVNDAFGELIARGKEPS